MGHMSSPSTPAIAAALRAEERMAQLLPALERTRRERARLDAQEAALLAEARRIADDWAAQEDPAATSAAEFSPSIRGCRDRRGVASERPHRSEAD